jgi:hypothetical protein
MRVTPFTRNTLRYRRAVRKLRLAGFEEVGEGGGRLWELHRGARTDHVITDVRIGPDRKTVWIKTAKVAIENPWLTAPT